jgi:MerR family copper efflux transcriptional regulator
MLIAEFAKSTGLPRDTVRYYEKLGLLRPVMAEGTGNTYRHYENSDVERAVLIRLGQALGFTLREIKELMLQMESDRLTDAIKINVMEQKLQDIDKRIRGLNEVKRYFKAKVQWVKTGGQGEPPGFKGSSKLNPAAAQRSSNPRKKD